MSKRLLIILVIIAGLMFGVAQLTGTNQKSQEHPASASPSSLSSMIGKRPPDFSLKNQRNETFSLETLRGKKVVLFFNEGIMCYPACWNQMAALGTDENLNNAAVVSASVVIDSPKEWDKAFAKMPELYKGNILFDTTKDTSFKYTMMSLPSSMHKGSMPGHTYLILDQNGIVRYTLDDPNMSIQNETLILELQKI